MPDDRYTYRKIASDQGEILIRDDGYRIEFLRDNEWHLWASYKQCGYVESYQIARALMSPPQRIAKDLADLAETALDAWLEWDRTAESDTEGAILERARRLTAIALGERPLETKT